jgi:glycerol-3-phosphate dehydrogenase (NAD(P)+)
VSAVRRDTVAVLGPAPNGRLFAGLAARNGLRVACWTGDAGRKPAARRPRRSPEAAETAPRRVATPDEALDGAGLVFLAAGAGDLPDLVAPLGDRLSADRIVVHGSKGLDADDGRRPSEMLALEIACRRLGALGGPYAPGEVEAGYAATLVIGSRFDEVHESVAAAIASERVRVRPTGDIVGVEIAGAAVVALGAAAGLCDGLGLGSGGRAVLLARGLAEAARLGRAAGADAETFTGPAGLADLLLISAETDGIGFRFGRRVGAGEPLDRIAAQTGDRTEALRTLDGLVALAARLRLSLPAFEALHAVLRRGDPPGPTLDALLRSGE